MTTCPNCGTEAPDNYAFCGNCGTDLRPARTIEAELKAAASAETPPPPAPTPVSSTGGNAFDTSAYDYATPKGPRRARPIVIWLVLAAIAVVCLCCGVALGATALYWLEPLPTPVPVPVPQPGSLLPFALLLV